MSRKNLYKAFLILLLACLIQINSDKDAYAQKDTIDFNDGVIALGTNNYDAAIAKFQSALNKNPYNIKAYNNLGIALQKKGDLNNSIQAYKQALQIDPGYGNALFNLGLCLKDSGAIEESIETLQRFISMNPNDPDAIKAKWIANELRDNIPNKNTKTEKYYLGSWLISDQNYIDAIPPLEKALQIDPTDYNCRFALGIAYKGVGNFLAASDTFRSLSQENPQDFLVLYNLADSLEKIGDVQGANQIWQRCIAIAPNSNVCKRLQSNNTPNIQQNFQNNPNINSTKINNSGFNSMHSNPSNVSDYRTTQISPSQNQIQPQMNNFYDQGKRDTNQNNFGKDFGYNIANTVNQGYSNPQNNYQPTYSPPPYNTGYSEPKYTPITTYGAGFSSPTPGTPANRSGKTRVAVMDFDYSGIRPWWSGDWNIGRGISSLLIGELVRSGSYSVIERTALEQVMNEQKMSTSSEFDPSSAATIGKILGVNILILGTVTNFGVEDKQKGLNTDLPGFAIASGLQSKSSTAVVSFDIRAISVETGEILSVTSVSGKSKRRGMLIDFNKNGSGGNVDFSSSNFTETILGEAALTAIKNASDQITQQYETLTKATIQTSTQDVGVVAYVGAQGVIINSGSATGLKIGNRLSIERVADVVKDPLTGNIIKSLTSNIAEIELTEIDANSATGRIVNAISEPQIGDIARFRADMNVVIPKSGSSTAVTGEIIKKKN